MGFFKAMGRVLAGKPVYEPEDISTTEQQKAAELTPAADVHNVVPVVRLTRVECPVQNGRMDLYVDVRNESSEILFVDKIHVLGTTRELDASLRPGEARQFHVFSGTPPQSAGYNMADVQYRTEKGDYFAAGHAVRYQKGSDGQLRVVEFRLITPIKDIH